MQMRSRGKLKLRTREKPDQTNQYIQVKQKNLRITNQTGYGKILMKLGLKIRKQCTVKPAYNT